MRSPQLAPLFPSHFISQLVTFLRRISSRDDSQGFVTWSNLLPLSYDTGETAAARRRASQHRGNANVAPYPEVKVVSQSRNSGGLEIHHLLTFRCAPTSTSFTLTLALRTFFYLAICIPLLVAYETDSQYIEASLYDPIAFRNAVADNFLRFHEPGRMRKT